VSGYGKKGSNFETPAFGVNALEVNGIFQENHGTYCSLNT
jgi:hypothetical protein